ncbi:g6f-like isoform X2 [Plectropomus leopardus]|uniref:g6f-like isoform X2 n=1 Tax=Plectropomus leopardus TaxID=160734 RepID=UPI001C4AE582|nr:g6f-like isoform X2 [Plectropomus leopardus]
MESGFLAVILVSSFAVYSSHPGNTEWEDVVVAREGMLTTLPCTDTVRGAVAINWMVKSLGAGDWKLVLSASESREFSGGASKSSMQLTDPNFQETGVFSLFLIPRMEDSGLYSCLIKQKERKIKEKIILLAILTVTVIPASPVPQQSTLRLIAKVNPDFAITKITWAAPGSISMKSEKKPNTGTVTKLPVVQNSDNGAYVCVVHPWGNSSTALFPFNVEVTVDADNVASFTSITHVKTRYSSSMLELKCLYSERSQVQSASWKHQNESRRLQLSSNGPGSIITTLALPITSDTAGNYTCTLRLTNGQTVFETQTVTLPCEDGRDVEIDSVTTPSLLPSLSALLLLVPLVAAAVCVLLWRQKHISDRGIEQSLSVHSGEAENIYENPEDIRQAPPQGSVYMDLKPRGEDDVYKELERY